MILGRDAIQTFRKSRGSIRGNSSTLVVFAYSRQFCMLLVTDFGSRCDPNVSGTSGPVTGNSSKLVVLAYSGQFCMLLVTDFGSHCDPNVSRTSGTSYGELVKTRSFVLFRPGLYAISH